MTGKSNYDNCELLYDNITILRVRGTASRVCVVVVVVAWLDMTSLSTRGWEIGLYAGETSLTTNFLPHLPFPPPSPPGPTCGYLFLYRTLQVLQFRVQALLPLPRTRDLNHQRPLSIALTSWFSSTDGGGPWEGSFHCSNTIETRRRRRRPWVLFGGGRCSERTVTVVGVDGE